MRSSCLLALVSIVASSAGLNAFEVRTPQTTGNISLVERHNSQELARPFPLSIDVDVRALDAGQLSAHLLTLPLRSTNGDPIASLAIDPRNAIAVGTSVRESELLLAGSDSVDGAVEIVVSASKRGELQVLTPEVVGAFSLDGVSRRFELLPFGKATSRNAHIVLLLDTSGSMVGAALERLKSTASMFALRLSEIGPNVLCRIVSFSDMYTLHGSGFAPCEDAVPVIRSLEAGGGTNLQTALLASFDLLRGKDSLSTILMVTDGRASIDTRAIASLKTAPVSALWLGSHWFQKRKFDPVIDKSLFGTRDIDALLQEFFSAFSNTVAHQYVVRFPAQETVSTSEVQP